MPSDPVIEEVRAVRHRISEQVGHDSARLVAYYREFQERYRDRLIRPGDPIGPGSERSQAADRDEPVVRAID